MTAITFPQPAAPDLFASEPADRMAFTGVLARDAEIRVKPVGSDSRPMPVLCLDLQDVGPGHHVLHAEQVYTEATRKHAEAAAARLRRGMRVTVTSPLDHLRLSLPHVETIALDATT